VPIFEAIVLGIVQGLTEFLPVSSSGHLLIVPWLFGWDSLDSDSVKKSFDVALHLGTLIAVVAYFRRDLGGYVTGGVAAVLRRERPVSEEGRIAWLLVLSAVPAGLVGFAARGFIVDALGTPLVIAVSLIGFGLLLLWADRSIGNRPLETVSTRDALAVGTAQILALNPGTSRSGITITAARRAGFSRDGAARLSFLMSLPVTGGAVVYELVGLAADGVPDGLVLPMVIGIITSAVAGWIAVWGTIRVVRTYSFAPFVIYRVGLGVLILVLLATGVRVN
jgi:undecaprenyl-diphosphatase